MFDSLGDRLGGVFKRLRAKGRLTEADVNEMLGEIRTALLEADVNIGVVRNVVQRLPRRLTRANKSSRSLTPNWWQCLVAKH